MIKRCPILLALSLSLAACGNSHASEPHAGHAAPAEGAPSPEAHEGHEAHAAHGEHAHHAEPAAEPTIAGRSLHHLDADVSLVDQHGARFALASLAGKPTLLTFFYSGCTTMCPLIVTDVKRIEAAIPAEQRERLNVVLITIDPRHDTVERLRAVAAERDLPPRWRLVTGDDASIRTVASTVGMTYRALPDGNFAHAALYTVLDSTGGVAHQLDGTGRPIEETVAAITRLLEPNPS